MSSIFDVKVIVESAHIDELGHVTHAAYIQWMQQATKSHDEQLGMSLNVCQQLKHAIVGVEQQVQYRKVAILGHEMILRTWLYDLNALYSFRQYVFYSTKDQSVIVTATMKSACIELITGRSKRLSPTFLNAYSPISGDQNPYDFLV